MIDKSLDELLVTMRERRAGDVFRFVRYGEMNKAIIALGAVDAIDEIRRFYDAAQEADARAAALKEFPSARKLPERISAFRSREFIKSKTKGSGNA